MKNKLKLSLVLLGLGAFIGCGNSNSKGSEKPSGTVGVQSYCSENTANLFMEVKRKSLEPLYQNNHLYETNQYCLQLQRELGQTSCQNPNVNSRDEQVISYSQIANYCNEVAIYAKQTDQDIPISRIDPRFGIYFTKEFLEEDDLSRRNNQTRCDLSVSNRINGELKKIKAKIEFFNVSIRNGRVTYDVKASVANSGNSVRLVCTSENLRLTVAEVNRLLNGVAELRKNVR